MLNKLKYLLWPLAVLYGLIMRIRNYAFDCKYLKSYQPQVPSIVIGNLSAGGTGKTPMVEYLLALNLREPIAVISRGYGRRSKGLKRVDPEGTASEFGDESLQIAQKFPKVKLWVSEKRALGAQIAERASCDLMVFDDAFQHRYVKGHFNILLSTYSAPFFKDHLLPMGMLRERRKGAQRADLIIFTKCPTLSKTQKENYREQAGRYAKAPVIFSELRYGEPKNSLKETLSSVPVEVITALAKPEPMLKHIEQQFPIQKHWRYHDHHLFNEAELQKIWQGDAGGLKSWLCSEKDAIKLRPIFKAAGRERQLFVLPVEHSFNEEDAQLLERLLHSDISLSED